MSIENSRLTLASIYGPNSDNTAFYQTISSKNNEIGNETIIWCGDLNMVLNPEMDYCNYKTINNQSRTNGPINAHLTIAQVMPRYNHNNEKQEALL